MIHIIAGGKNSTDWEREACWEYEKRLKKPFEIKWEFLLEKKLEEKLTKWSFDNQKNFVILLDERGKFLSSPDFSEELQKVFLSGKNLVFIVGGAFGVDEEARQKADLVLSFSKMVFPHRVARLLLVEQIYRAQEIASGGRYHHGN